MPYHHIWMVPVPLKIWVLMWLAMKGRLNTLDLLAHKGINLSTLHSVWC